MKKKKFSWKRVVFWIVLISVVSLFVFPIFWVYVTAFKTNAAIRSTSLAFTPTIENFVFLFTTRNAQVPLLNTIIISVVSTLLVMLISIPAAYSFARYSPSGNTLLFTTISTRMFPGVIAAIPFFLLFRDLNLLDTHIGIILMYVYFNMSFATFLMYGFFVDIPEQVEYAAMVDGYSRLDIIRKIVFPLAKPGIAITTIFTLIWSWNEFFFAFLFTGKVAKAVSVELSLFWGATQIQWGAMAALMCIAMLPTLAVAIFLQKYIVRGLSFGAVKG
ncbi:MAG: carbohydrate ABC transporter permease [Lachnospiraceae bacterium]|jgi:multiple sugar transport system permease protein|nr:carbohydrate ABC transporter permease [Lachnospiraceae bacterium]